MNPKTKVRQEIANLAAMVVVLGNLAISYVITSFLVFDPGRLIGITPRGFNNHPYLAMFSGNPLNPDTAFWNYRTVIPELARLVPDLPIEWMFRAGRHFDPAGLAGVKFALVNLVFLVATTIVLYFLVQGFGLTRWHGLAGGALYLSMYEVAASSGQPMIEPGYFFFMAMAALAVQRQNAWLMMGIAFIGVFVKEQTLLEIGLIVLAPYAWRQRGKLLLAMIPAVGLYGMVRFWLAPLGHDTVAAGDFLLTIPTAIRFVASPLGMFGLLTTFGLLWIPIIYSLFRCPLPTMLRRWAWFIPLTFAAVLLNGGGYEAHGMSRLLSVTFVVGVPLALFGLSKWLSLERPNEAFVSLQTETSSKACKVP